MKVHVDPWDPSYGTALEGGGEGPQAESSATVVTDVELPAAHWAGVDPAPGVTVPDVVLLVDGVQRVDARIWVTDDEGETHPGLAASYAAGVVRCDLRNSSADVAVARVERGLFSPCPTAPTLGAGLARYVARRVGSGEPRDLLLAVQRHLRGLEIAVSGDARAHPDIQDDLLVVDGPLQQRAHLPRAIGYAKTHQKKYLPAELSTVVTRLRSGQRSPVFRIGAPANRYSWYLRLPGQSGAPWTGIVRAECAGDLEPDAAIALAHRSAVTLPRFASSAYKDPRAPQNLVPIAGLERRLRSMLGDARLLHRALNAASRQAPIPA